MIEPSDQVVDAAEFGESGRAAECVRRARGGTPMFVKEKGEVVAVMIPIWGFRGVQKAIDFLCREMPVTCWRDPEIVYVARADSGVVPRKEADR